MDIEEHPDFPRFNMINSEKASHMPSRSDAGRAASGRYCATATATWSFLFFYHLLLWS
jgi:hypothetical protein